MNLQSVAGAVTLLVFFGLGAHSVCRWALSHAPASGAWEGRVPAALGVALAAVLAVVLFRAAEAANVLAFLGDLKAKAVFYQMLSAVGPSLVATALGALSLQTLAVRRTPLSLAAGLMLLWWAAPIHSFLRPFLTPFAADPFESVFMVIAAVAVTALMIGPSASRRTYGL